MDDGTSQPPAACTMCGAAFRECGPVVAKAAGMAENLDPVSAAALYREALLEFPRCLTALNVSYCGQSRP